MKQHFIPVMRLHPHDLVPSQGRLPLMISFQPWGLQCATSYSVKLHQRATDFLTIGAVWWLGEERDQQAPCQGTRGHVSVQNKMCIGLLSSSSRFHWSSPPNSGLEADLSVLSPLMCYSPLEVTHMQSTYSLLFECCRAAARPSVSC